MVEGRVDRAPTVRMMNRPTVRETIVSIQYFPLFFCRGHLVSLFVVPGHFTDIVVVVFVFEYLQR